jgi:5'-nucleotidase
MPSAPVAISPSVSRAAAIIPGCPASRDVSVARRAAAWALLACAVAGCLPPAASAPPSTPPALVEITLLQINDTYVLEPVDDGRRGGMARLATQVKRLRAAHPNVVFAHAGDLLSPSPMSTVLRGAQMIAVLNALGLDVATFGNHEFDFGARVLRARMAESRFAWLSANVTERGTRRPFGGAAREAMLERGGRRIGLFGLTTADAATTSAGGADVDFADPAAEGKAVAGELRRAGAQLVVGVTHQHMDQDRALATAANVDVILGGHEHEPLVAEEGKALITKAGSDARYLVEIDVWLRGDGAMVERSWTFHEISARLPEDPDVAAVVRQFDTRLGRALATEVGRTTVALEARRAPLRTSETNLGDFIADAMRARLSTDVALVNGGGVRTDRLIPAGPLTRRDVLGLLPFTNVVMKVEVTGARLREAIEQGLSRIEREGGGFLQVSGLRLAYDPRLPAGRRVLAVDVDGAPLDAAKTYTAAVVDWIARGGDGVTALRDGRVLIDAVSGPQLSDIVLDAIAARGTIAPSVDGRLHDATR